MTNHKGLRLNNKRYTDNCDMYKRGRMGGNGKPPKCPSIKKIIVCYVMQKETILTNPLI